MGWKSNNFVFILEDASRPFHDISQHSGDKAQDFISKTKLNRYQHLGNGFRSAFEKKLPRSSRNRFVDDGRYLSIQALDQGFIIDSSDLSLGIYSGLSYKTLCAAFPKGLILALVEQDEYFGFSLYRDGIFIRSWGNSDFTEDGFDEKGKLLREEKDLIQHLKRSGPNPEEENSSPILLGDEEYYVDYWWDYCCGIRDVLCVKFFAPELPPFFDEERIAGHIDRLDAQPTSHYLKLSMLQYLLKYPRWKTNVAGPSNKPGSAGD